jgi:predicted DCC family thiol-disulfide oxidoreductase YuxK
MHVKIATIHLRHRVDLFFTSGNFAVFKKFKGGSICWAFIIELFIDFTLFYSSFPKNNYAIKVATSLDISQNRRWSEKLPGLTVLYDGHCSICSAGAARLRRRDRRGQIELLDLHDPAVPVRFPQIDPVEAMRLMQAVDQHGHVYSGVDAWARIGRALPGWKYAAWLLRVPGIHLIARWIYAWIARNRYRWNRQPCSDSSCAIHSGKK